MGSESPMELKVLDLTGNTIILKVKHDSIEITATNDQTHWSELIGHHYNKTPHTCSIKEFKYLYSDEWKKNMDLSGASVLSYKDDEKEWERRFSPNRHRKLEKFLWLHKTFGNLVKTMVDKHTARYVLSEDVKLLAFTEDKGIVPAEYNSQGEKQNFVNEYFVRAEYNPPHERL